MQVLVRTLGHTWVAHTEEAEDIAIVQRFDDAQPNAFGLADAVATTVAGEGWALSVEDGAPVNCDTVTLTPHANGTHTESVRHITADGPFLPDVLRETLMVARLVTIPLMPRGEVAGERYLGTSEAHDQVIAAEMLRARLPDSGQTPPDQRPQAVIVRHLPNTADKPARRWAGTNPPYFTEDAIRLLRDRGFQHLLVDLPSVDREVDDGAVAAHRAWWNLPAVGSSAGDPPSQRTITELVWVPDRIPDGLYLLELQAPAFALDAAPSRPRITPLRRADRFTGSLPAIG